MTKCHEAAGGPKTKENDKQEDLLNKKQKDRKAKKEREGHKEKKYNQES